MTPGDYLRNQVGTVTTFDQMLNTVADALDQGAAEPQRDTGDKHNPEATHKR